MSKTGVK
ncbi:hypothetical protein VCHFU02_1697, partial [Vibrio cholerae HFU-02]